MSGYVPLPTPVTADPGFWQKGIEGLNALRDQQAKQASADAYRQSLNPDGTVNTPKYNALIASGPGAWNAGELMRQQGAAGIAQTGAAQGQFNLASAQNSAVNGAATAALAVPDDQLHATVAQQIQRLIDANMVPRDKGMTWLANLSNDPAQMRQQLETIRVQTLPPQQQQNWIYGTRPTITTPNATYMPEVPEPGRGPPVTIVTPHGVAPAPAMVPDTRPGAPPGTYTPVIPPGGGGGPPTAVPIQPQPGVPSGRIRPPAGSPLLNPAAPPPASAPATSTPAPPAIAPAAPAPAPGVPTADSGQPTYTAPPSGQGDVLGKDIEARTAASTAMPDQQKRLIAGQSALEALNLAKYTGPSTGWVARANAFLKAQGISTVDQGTMSETDYRQILQKNLLRFAQSSAKSTGTDLGLETQLHSNANVDEMLPGANRHVLIQDLGILKRDMAQTREMPPASGTGDVVRHLGTFSDKTAPEAFMWNEYSGDERKAVEKDYEDKGQTKKLYDSLELAVKHGAIPDPRKAVLAAPPAVVAPPPPARNALVPTN